MRFAYLGSGSRGNAAVVEAGDTLVLIDCGFSVKETRKRLARLDKVPEDLTAILVTHEHSDHFSGVARLSKRYSIPVWLTPGTHAATGERVAEPRLFDCHGSFTLAAVTVEPVPVPHDAREPCQYVLSDGRRRIGVLTDTGHITPHIRKSYSHCDALAVECNHDRDLLENGPYPVALKRRVGGRLGHLSNAQTAELVGEVVHSGLKHVVAVHLSAQNNTPDHARDALSEALDCSPGDITVADQDDGMGWLDV